MLITLTPGWLFSFDTWAHLCRHNPISCWLELNITSHEAAQSLRKKHSSWWRGNIFQERCCCKTKLIDLQAQVGQSGSLDFVAFRSPQLFPSRCRKTHSQTHNYRFKSQESYNGFNWNLKRNKICACLENKFLWKL